MKEAVRVERRMGGRVRKGAKVASDHPYAVSTCEKRGLSGAALRKPVDAQGRIQRSNRMVQRGYRSKGRSPRLVVGQAIQRGRVVRCKRVVLVRRAQPYAVQKNEKNSAHDTAGSFDNHRRLNEDRKNPFRELALRL